MRNLLLRFLGWAIDAYPNVVAYSTDFMPDLDLSHWDDERVETFGEVHANSARTAGIGVAVASQRVLTKPGMTLTMEYTAVTDRGRNIGSYRITVERLKPASVEE